MDRARSVRGLLGAVALMVAGVSSAAAAEPPAFRLLFSGLDDPIAEDPGTLFSRSTYCLLGVEPTGDPSLGATGWSLGFSAEGVTIVDATTDDTYAAPIGTPRGLRDGGFERTELTADGVGDCAGRKGAISVVALSDLGTVTLPVDRYYPPNVVSFRVEAVFPGAGELTRARLFYVDGCRGTTGDPVSNRVSYGGGTAVPELLESSWGLRGSPPCPSTGAALQLILQRRNVGQTPDLLAGIIPTSDPYQPGILVVPPGRADVYVGMVSDQPDPDGYGVQGWSLSIGVSGDAKLLGVTTRGTAAAPASQGPPGIQDRGYEKTELVDPDREYVPSRGYPQGQGAISAVVLSFFEPTALDAVGTATVLALTLEGDLGAVAAVGCRHGLIGSGSPIANVATVHGETRVFDCCQRGEIRFAVPESPFHRGDVNDDGRLDIGDPIRLLGNLFLGATRPPCRDAADFNDDGGVDISDVISSLNFLFLGGPEPPAPGPPGRPCGVDPLPHTDGGCYDYVSC